MATESGTAIESDAAATETARYLAAQVDNFVSSIGEKEMRLTRLLSGLEVDIDDHMDEAVALINGVRVQREARNHMREEVAEKVRSLHDRTSAQLLQEHQERHRMETRLELLIDEKCGDVKGYVADDVTVQKEADRYTREIRDEVCHLYNNIEEVRQYREEKGKSIAEAVRYKLNEVHDAIAAEQRLRLDSRDTLLELLGQMGEKMEKELDASRKERHAATDRLIKVMEGLLPKLDSSTKKKVRACTDELNENNSAGRMAKTLAETVKSRKNNNQTKAMLHKGRVTDAQ